jgi:hypothetical protein
MSSVDFFNLKGMLKSIRGLCGYHHKDCEVIYKFWRQRIVKQDESYGDLEFKITIELGGKSTSYWKTDKREFRKCRRVCKAYRNPILEFDVGHTSFENKGKACGA